MPAFITPGTILRCVSTTKNSLTTSRLPRRYMSTMHDNDPDVLETEKRRNLSNQQHKTSTPHADAPGWNEHLASASEASVKADRSSPSSTNELQSRTVNYVTARYASDNNASPTTAYYSRDEVSGPLGSAPGQEDTQELRETVVEKKVYKTTHVAQDEPPPKGSS